MIRLSEGINVQDGNISMNNDIYKTSMGKTYRGYLKSRMNQIIISSWIATNDEVIEAWLDIKWTHRFKKKVLRMLKHPTNILKGNELGIKNTK